MSDTLKSELDRLTTQVTNATTVEASAVALIKGFSARLDAAVAAATTAGATSAQLQPFADLGAALDTGTTSLADAVAANTPAA